MKKMNPLQKPVTLRFSVGILTLLSLGLFGIGCVDASLLNSIEYNNKVVETLNQTSTKIEITTDLYDTNIPNIVTENSTVNTTELKEAFVAIEAELLNAKEILTLKSRDAEQETAVREQFTAYLKLANTYTETYRAMMEYYAEGGFKTDLDGVGRYDQDLHKQYNSFIEANNALVDTLSSFVE